MDSRDKEQSVQLTAEAQRTLEQVAEALGVTTALLGGRERTQEVEAGERVSLWEASALLQTYLKIEDRRVRQRCLDLMYDAVRKSQ